WVQWPRFLLEGGAALRRYEPARLASARVWAQCEHGQMITGTRWAARRSMKKRGGEERERQKLCGWATSVDRQGLRRRTCVLGYTETTREEAQSSAVAS